MSLNLFYMFQLVEWATFITPVIILSVNGQMKNDTFQWMVFVTSMLMIFRCIYISIRHTTTPELEYLRYYTNLITPEERSADLILGGGMLLTP